MKNLITLALLVGAVAAGGWLVYFGPYYKDYYTMEEVAESVVLTWQAYTKERAKGEINHQLKARGIDYITPAHFALREEAGEKVVEVEWQVDVYPPLVGGRRLDFYIEQRVDASGEVVR